MSAFLIVRRLLAPCVFAASIHAASDGMKPVRASAGSPAGRMLSTFVPTPVAAALAPETLKGTELRRLEQLPPVAIPIQDAPLGTAVSAVATAAGMNFVAPPAGEFAENVTFSAKVNPWRLLGILGDRYGFTCRFDNGVWLFDRTVVDALESRTYTLKHTNLDVYKAAQNSFNLLSTGTPGAGENGMNAQAGGLVFTPETRKIIDDIQDLLGIARASGHPGSADEVRKGGEIALGAQRPFFGYHRHDAGIEEIDEGFEGFHANARIADREGVGAEEGHGAHDLLGQGLADTAGVADDEIVLK